MRCKSSGIEVVTKFAEELPMRVGADEKTTNIAKSESDDGSVPMTGTGGCR